MNEVCVVVVDSLDSKDVPKAEVFISSAFARDYIMENIAEDLLDVCNDTNLNWRNVVWNAIEAAKKESIDSECEDTDLYDVAVQLYHDNKNNKKRYTFSYNKIVT